MPVIPAPKYSPVFESAPCAITTPNQVRVDCGFVIVPEDRRKDIFDTIRLAVVIYRSTNSAPKPDPIFYLQGGPGDEAITWSVDAYESVFIWDFLWHPCSPVDDA